MSLMNNAWTPSTQSQSHRVLDDESSHIRKTQCGGDRGSEDDAGRVAEPTVNGRAGACFKG